MSILRINVFRGTSSLDPNFIISLNYNEKIEKIRSILECWKFRRLTLLGKIAVLKSLVASQLVYIFSPLQTNHEAIKEINTIFYKFLWNDKGDKIKRKIMINDYSEGVNRLRRQNTKTQSKYENRFSKFLMSQKPSKFIYQEIVSKNCERPISCQEKWRKDINLPPKEIINWKVAYQTSFQCTKSSKLITFNFKLLHRRYQLTVS